MADYTIKGKDGKIRRFTGLDKPPTPEELDAIEQSEAPKERPTPVSEWLADHVTDAIAHPFESVVPKETQLKVASKIAGSEQQPAQSSVIDEIANLFGKGGTLSAFWNQPVASMRGAAAGVSEGLMDQLSPFQIGASLIGEELPSFGKGFGPITRTAGKVAASTARRGVQAVTDAAGAILPEGASAGVIPDLVGIASPRMKNALKAVGAMREAEAGGSIPAELREVFDAIRSKHGDVVAEKWLTQQGGRSAVQKAAGAVSRAEGAVGASTSAEATTAKPATYGKPSPVNDGPWRSDFTRAAEAEATPAAKAAEPPMRGQPVKASTEPAPRPTESPRLDSGETEEQWRARMQERINKANETSRSAKTSLEEDISNLRRKYGAERIGKLFRPDAPEVGNGVVTRNDMNLKRPAQSWAPDIAQQALLQDLKAGSTKDPSKTLRALSQVLKEYKRNGGAASSPVARELEQLLKTHGFLSE